MQAQAHVLADSTLSFNSIHDRTRWAETWHIRDGTFVVERVRLRASGIAIEGSFELPLLAQLPVEDQLFIVAFVRCHGSIKRSARGSHPPPDAVNPRLNAIVIP
jgi:hypothetical protein